MEENKKYYDYLNNQIKEGMVIQHINTKSRSYKLSGSHNPNNFIDIPERKIWNIVSEYRIIFNKEYNMLFADLMNCDIVISQPLNLLLGKIDLDRSCIAIKGISEKEQNYISK